MGKTTFLRDKVTVLLSPPFTPHRHVRERTNGSYHCHRVISSLPSTHKVPRNTLVFKASPRWLSPQLPRQPVLVLDAALPRPDFHRRRYVWADVHPA